MKQIDMAQAAQTLRKARAVCVFAHSHPDGDALGSAFALAHALCAMDKQACVLCEDPMPAMFDYMRDGVAFLPPGDVLPFEPDLLVTVDTAAAHLLGEEFQARYGERIDLSIDHHPSSHLYAAATHCDPTAAACAEIIGELIDELEVPMTTHMAACLYAGISTDTGGFRYSNTTARSHRCAARYIELGVETGPLNRVFFETQSRAYLEMERMAFAGLRYFCDDRVALVAVTQEMFRQSGSNEEEYIQLVARTRQIEGVQVGVAIRERPDGSYKISLRSHAPADVAAIAARMGGGGHLRAAAYVSEMPLEETIATLVGHIEEALHGD